jgi:hypothetical protein
MKNEKGIKMFIPNEYYDEMKRIKEEEGVPFTVQIRMAIKAFIKLKKGGEQ